MPSLCNSTLTSTPDQDESQYWSSFSERPFSCGDRLQVYKGKLNGKGPRQGDFAVVKVFSDSPGTEARCLAEVTRSKACSHWLERFLARGGYHPRSVRLARLQAAPVDQVSVLNKVMAIRCPRTPRGGEWVLLEEMIGSGKKGDSLVGFVDKRGRAFRDGAIDPRQPPARLPLSSSPPSPVSCRTDLRHLAEAFVHFVHQASGGREAVCGLEGLASERTGGEGAELVLKTPVIHSCRGAYGETDLGPSGVRDVMKNHACNRHCQRVLGLGSNSSSSSLSSISSSPQSSLSLSSSATSVGSFPRASPLPSAPYDPDVVAPVRDHNAALSGPTHRDVVDHDDDVARRDGSSMTSPPSYEELEELGVIPQPADTAEESRLMFYLELEPACPQSPPPRYNDVT